MFMRHLGWCGKHFLGITGDGDAVDFFGTARERFGKLFIAIFKLSGTGFKGATLGGDLASAIRELVDTGYKRWNIGIQLTNAIGNLTGTIGQLADSVREGRYLTVQGT